MARQLRHFVPNQPLLVLLRGNNRSQVFIDDADYQVFADWLLDTGGTHRCEIHAYVLMPNHIHLLVTPWYESSLPKLMQSMGRRYVRYFNDRYQRSGTLWEGRYRSALIDSQVFLLDCIRYIEENPIRAGLVSNPEAYLWSSAKTHRLAQPDHVLTEHVLFQALGSNREERAQAYLNYCARPLDGDRLALIQHSAHSGWPLGTDRFKDELEHFSSCRARPLPRGRPRKLHVSKSQKG